MKNLAKGDLGTSFAFKGKSVNDLLASRIKPSLILGAQAMVFGTLVGILLGMLAALKQNTFWDYGSTFLRYSVSPFHHLFSRLCCSIGLLLNGIYYRSVCGMTVGNQVSCHRLHSLWGLLPYPRVSFGLR